MRLPHGGRTVEEIARAIGAADDRLAAADASRAGAERRKGNTLLLYWQSLRAGRPYPALADVDPGAIAQLWRFCFAAELWPGGLRFSYLGHAVRRGYGMNEGTTPEGIPPKVLGVLRDPCREAVETRAPVLTEGVAPNAWGDAKIKRAVQTGQAPIGERLLSAHQNENPIFGIDSVPFLATNFEASEKLWGAARPAIEKILDEQNLVLLYAVPHSPLAQPWNRDDSAPFRTTDHQPEVIWVLPWRGTAAPLGWRLRLLLSYLFAAIQRSRAR